MIIIGDNFFDGLQVVFGTMLVWSEVSRRGRAWTWAPRPQGPRSPAVAAGGGFSGGWVWSAQPPSQGWLQTRRRRSLSALEQLVLELLGAGLRGHMGAIFL